jgi:hypothetical protein
VHKENVKMAAPLELAGEHMTIVEDENGVSTITFDDVGTGRRCGSCQLCCKLVPVPPIKKAAGERCKHSKTGHGCTIHAGRPYACMTWSCRWLADPKTAGMPRPDRAHYVIDMTPDTIAITYNDTGQMMRLDVLQVWVDPAFPNAHQAPELRAFMLMFAQRFRAATIVRWNSNDAMVVFPPPLASDGKWHEQRAPTVARNEGEAAILRGFRETSVTTVG